MLIRSQMIVGRSLQSESMNAWINYITYKVICANNEQITAQPHCIAR